MFKSDGGSTIQSDAGASEGDSKGCVTLGEGVVFKGTISVPGKFVVNGTVEGGDIEARELLVGGSGVVSGKVIVDSAVVHGKVTEHIEAKVLLSIGKSGRVEGSAIYEELEIEKGGRISGSISTKAADQADDSNIKKFGSQKVTKLVPSDPTSDLASRG